MKSFTIASAFLFAAAAFTGTSALPVANPQTEYAGGTCPTPTTTATATATVTASPTPLETSPPLPLFDYQQPISLDNSTHLISASLVMTVDSSRPDTPIPRVRQIGPNAFVSIPFTSSHAGRLCRFHFAFSNLADGGNGQGAEEIYALKSGVVDETLTYNKQPVLEDAPVASFLMNKATVTGNPPVELYIAEKRSDFPCPGEATSYAIRARDGSVSNWSWNKGLVVEVLEEGKGWWDDANGGKY